MASTIDMRRGIRESVLFNLILALVVVGVVMGYDAGYARTMELKLSSGDGFYFLKRQAAYAGLGLAAMLMLFRTGYWKLRMMVGPLLLLAIVLLVAVWIPGIGLHKNGAARWIGRGVFQIQPSEFAKLVLVIYLAGVLARYIDNNPLCLESFKDGLLAPLVVVGVVFVLVEREPDLGTAVVIGLACLTLFRLAGARWSYLMGICALGATAIVCLSLLHGFRSDRIMAFIHPRPEDYLGRGYQKAHGLMAVGSGGLAGVGFGAGREKFYLPEANTDFIFATIAEEMGLWGSTGVIALLLLIAWRAVEVARRTRDTFGSLLAAGIAALISWQAIINIAVVTGLLPTTGVPLPFISFGGTSLVFMMGSMGILLNIAQHPDGKRTIAA